jgi:hypothetical protein
MHLGSLNWLDKAKAGALDERIEAVENAQSHPPLESPECMIGLRPSGPLVFGSILMWAGPLGPPHGSDYRISFMFLSDWFST